jgi:hypothetical protein
LEEPYLIDITISPNQKFIDKRNYIENEKARQQEIKAQIKQQEAEANR